VVSQGRVTAILQHTVSVGVGGDTTHAELRNSLKQAIGYMAISRSDGIQRTENSQDTIVDTGDDLADAGADTSLVTEFGDILTSFSNNDACFLRGDDSSQSKLSEGILVVGAGRCIFVVVFEVETVEGGINVLFV
jgi:hypothetical protein